MPPLAPMAIPRAATAAATAPARRIRPQRNPDVQGDMKIARDTSKRSRVRRRVKWGSSVTYDDDLVFYSDQECHNTWHSRNELNEYRSACLYTVELIENGLDICEDNGLCLRGLEGFTIEGRNRREKNKAVSKHLVFKTQELQSKTRMVSNDPSDFLSRTYQKACVDAVRTAYAQALIDYQLAAEATGRRTKPHRFVQRATPIVAILLRKLDLQRSLCSSGYNNRSTSSSSCNSSTSSTSRRQKQLGCVTRLIANRTPASNFKTMSEHAPSRSRPKKPVPELVPGPRSPSSKALVPELASASAGETSTASNINKRKTAVGKRNRCKRGLLRKLWY